LAFEPKQIKTRVVNKVKGGVVTFAGAQPPIDVYSGPTARLAVKKAAIDSGRASRNWGKSVSGPNEEDSLGNVSRGERI
jgi:hypothetical protein